MPAELTADFWLTDPSLRERVVEMQQRAYELQVTATSEEIFPEAIPLAEVRARTLVVRRRERQGRLPRHRRSPDGGGAGCPRHTDQGIGASAGAGAAGRNGPDRSRLPRQELAANAPTWRRASRHRGSSPCNRPDSVIGFAPTSEGVPGRKEPTGSHIDPPTRRDWRLHPRWKPLNPNQPARAQWRSFAADPSSRKRFFKMMGGAGAASAFAIFLAACGDDDEGSSSAG